jgi:hypothetical protein
MLESMSNRGCAMFSLVTAFIVAVVAAIGLSLAMNAWDKARHDRA